MLNLTPAEIAKELVEALENSPESVLTFRNDAFRDRYRNRFKESLKNKLSDILLNQHNVLILFGNNVVVACFDRNFKDGFEYLPE